MKNNIIKGLVFLFVALVTFISCERDIVKIESESAPITMDLSKETVFLDKKFPDNPVLTVSWEAAKFNVPVEISYKIEASKDDKFTNPYLLSTVKNSVKSETYTVDQVNKAAQAIGLVKDVAANMYIRVSSYVGASEGYLSTSNVTYVKVTPYELDYPTFYLVGGATYVGWTDSKAQLLYKNSNTSTIYTYLEGGSEFRFLGQQNWNPLNYSIDQAGIKDSYKYFKVVPSTIKKSDANDENMVFSGTTGIYKILINAAPGVQSMSITASPVAGYDFPEIYLVGSVNGWDPKNPTTMAKTGDGIYEATVKLDDNSEFKFIGQKDWGNLDWGNIGGTAGNTGFLGPKGDNSNIKFNGGGSNYKVTVNVKGGIYTIVKQ